MEPDAQEDTQQAQVQLYLACRTWDPVLVTRVRSSLRVDVAIRSVLLRAAYTGPGVEKFLGLRAIDSTGACWALLSAVCARTA